jgi:hypothetical protein
MSVTQTIEVPESRRVTLEIPREIPMGQVILTFTPASSNKKKMTEAEEIEYINDNAESLNKEAIDVLSYQVGIF